MIKITGSSRIGRGGSWGYDADGCEISDKVGIYPADRDDSLGFRILRRLKTKGEIK